MALSDARPEPFDAAFLRSLESLMLAVGRLRAGGDGGRRGGPRGGRVEFAGHRPYSPGDEVRFVDWAAYARTGRLVVKQFDREDRVELLLVVDDSASMGVGPTGRAAARLALALGRLSLVSGDGVSVRSTSGRVGSGRVEGRERWAELAQVLRGLDWAGPTDLAGALRRLPRRSLGTRAVVLVSDLLAADDGRQAVEALRAAGDLVHVLCLRDPSALDPPLDERLLVVDAETGEEREVGPDALRAARAVLAERDEDWRRFAVAHGVGFVELDARRPTAELVLGPLVRAGIVG